MPDSAPMATDPDPPPILIGRDGAVMLALSLAIAVLSGGLSFLVAVRLVWRTARRAAATPPLPPQRALVLGQVLTAAGSPGRGFEARLARARMLAATWPALEVVVLGGVTTPGLPSEAAAGRAWLLAHGMEPRKILLEDGSRHTLENLVRYRARFGVADGPPPVLITSRFHLARSSLLAAGLDIAHVPCAAEATWQPTRALVRPLLMEALLVHWYVTGRCFARLTRNRRMFARIS